MSHYYIEIPATEEERELLIAELWERGTTGVAELEDGRGGYVLRASFDEAAMAASFGVPVVEDATDWAAAGPMNWPSRLVGKRFFLAPSWSDEPTPEGRWRIDYQDGAACGSGEHPSTRQAMEALEDYLQPGMRVADIGCGAGLLSLAAKLLGAAFVVGADIEEDSCQLTRKLSGVPVVQGSAGCLQGEFDVVVANISPMVLLDLADELLRLAKPGGRLILAGFGVEEAATIRQVFGSGAWQERTEGEWSSVVVEIPALGD